MAAPMSEIRVLELYSGIGGMHFALQGSGLQYKVVTAIDVNTNANKVYKHNFPSATIVDSAIEALTLKKYEALNVDMILMSPPCQPFTRVGKQEDVNDPRTKSFLHVLKLLSTTNACPRYILVENVRGFETSESRNKLIEMLKLRNYKFQEFLLTPLQFGIPNSRLRYFLIAKLSPLEFAFETSNQIIQDVPKIAGQWLIHKHQAGANIARKDRGHDPNIQCETVQGQEGQGQKIQEGQTFKGEGHKCMCGGYISKTTEGIETSTDFECEKWGLKRSEIDDTHHSSIHDSKRQKTRDLAASENNVIEDSSKVLSNETALKIHKNVTDTAEDRDINNIHISAEDKHSCEESDDSSRVADQKSKASSIGEVDETKNLVQSICSSTSDAGDNSVTDNNLMLQMTRKSYRDKNEETDSVRYDCLENYGFNMRQSGDPALHKPCLALHHFLDKDFADTDKFQAQLLPDKDLKRFVIMDVVTPCSIKSNCFTKRYGHYIEGAGSVVQMSSDIQVIQKASELKDVTIAMKNRDRWGDEEMSKVRALKLRYFTPREIANILCFPQDFDFPKDLTTRQQYMLLGNSLNVSMVSVLLKMLTAGDFDQT